MMRWWCRRRGWHNWLMGESLSQYIPTPDICLTCRASKVWAPALVDGTGSGDVG